jgi:hypothetical protein
MTNEIFHNGILFSSYTSKWHVGVNQITETMPDTYTHNAKNVDDPKTSYHTWLEKIKPTVSFLNIRKSLITAEQINSKVRNNRTISRSVSTTDEEKKEVEPNDESANDSVNIISEEMDGDNLPVDDRNVDIKYLSQDELDKKLNYSIICMPCNSFVCSLTYFIV